MGQGVRGRGLGVVGGVEDSGGVAGAECDRLQIQKETFCRGTCCLEFTNVFMF